MKTSREREQDVEPMGKMGNGGSTVGRGAVQADRGSQYPMSNNRYPITNGSDRRRGVALIVVLGFLSLMVMMAVAFLTHARVEREVSNYTLEAMRGRQLLRTALHAAMNDYSVEMAKASLVMAPFDSGYDLFVSKPPKPLFGLNGRTIGQDGIELLVGEVEDWIPRKFTNVPYLAKTTVPNEAEWILVRENPASPQPSRILGRYAYAVFDMSGGIDANLIARDVNIAEQDSQIASNRIRRSVRKVPMGLLPETANGGQFKLYRQGWKGFDSLYALIKLTDGYPNDGNAGSDTRWQLPRKEGAPPAGLHSNLVSDLTPFSLSAFRGGRFNAGTATWSPYVLCGSQPWSTVLSPISAQFAPGWASWIENAINDYTNQNTKIPLNTDYPSPKNVPMLNELNLTYRLIRDLDPADPTQARYNLEVRLTPEFWYPFPSTDNVSADTFQMPPPTIDGGPAASGPSQIWIQMMMPPQPVKVGPVTAPGLLNVAAKYNNGKPYVADATTNFIYTIPIVPLVDNPTNPLYPLPSNKQLLINVVKLGQKVYLTGPGGNADMIPENLLLSPTPVTLLPDQPAPAARVLEVTDPRLNHLPGQWVLQGAPSLGERNVWNPAAEAKFLAEGTNMYCRNGPMHTPAELGYIPTGLEWATIDLCTADAAGMLANLVADTNLFKNWSANKVIDGVTVGNVFYTNGTINPNTRSSNVLASAFYGLATHEAPSVSNNVVSAAPITADQAYVLAQSILDETKSGKLNDPAAPAFQAGTDWARVKAMQQGGALSKLGLNNNQRESLIRNTWGLFSPENSLFTVVVVAQAIKEAPASADPVGVWNANADMITGERRGVALVWRDPFKNGNNLHHEMFVRMFRYLND